MQILGTTVKELSTDDNIISKNNIINIGIRLFNVYYGSIL